MIRRALDWLGAARRENDEVNADAVRIASLEKTLASVRGDLARAIQGNAAWAAKYADLQDKITDLSVEIAELLPLAETGRKRKAACARYRKGRK